MNFHLVNFLCILTSVILTSVTSSTPHYHQCDSRWGNDTIGKANVPISEDSTICHVGCAMTSLSMLLAQINTTTSWLKKERTEAITPKSFNQWLIHHNGYDCVEVGTSLNASTAIESKSQPNDLVCFDLLSQSITNLTGRIVYQGYRQVSLSEMSKGMQQETTSYIAHVKNGHHFVLVTAVNVATSSITVLDPYFNVTEYPFANVSGALIYKMRLKEVPKQYPTYKQCDALWGPHEMVNTTVCKVGCIMSSTSMALAGHGIDVNGLDSNPGSFNQWLRTHNGYIGANNFEEGSIDNVSSLLPHSAVWPSDGHHGTNDIDTAELKLYIETRVVIANVLKGRHFVLVVGVDALDSDVLYVNDPGFNRTTYSYSKDVVGWRLFDMK